jgi:transcription elongation factor Elf1
MELTQQECPKCGAPMGVMASMPSLQEKSSLRFLLCSQCGKVELERKERGERS